MKLYEVVKPKVDWNKKSEKQQIAIVRRSGYMIRRIANPSEAVKLAAVSENGHVIDDIDNPSEAIQLAAVNSASDALIWITKKGIVPSDAVQSAAVSRMGSLIRYIKHPSSQVVKVALTDQRFIGFKESYEREVKRIFSNNALLMKKWLRYGETMRNQE